VPCRPDWLSLMGAGQRGGLAEPGSPRDPLSMEPACERALFLHRSPRAGALLRLPPLPPPPRRGITAPNETELLPDEIYYY